LQAGDVEQIGFARLITDNITFAYITDLYVLPDYQGLGLGEWILDCVDESLSALPYLRWAMLRTSVQKSKESYEKRLGMSLLPSGDTRDGPVVMGKKGRAGRA
jgi:ribosomal protein S18 acetylase RimI-like enzyme